MTPIAVDLSKGGDYADPGMQSARFSGTLDIDISVDEMTDNPTKNLFEHEIRSAVREQTAELLALPKGDEQSRSTRTSSGFPTISAEVESEMDGTNYHHRMRVGVTLPNPEDYSSEQCLDAYANHIASAIGSILPKKLDLLKNQKKGVLYTAGEIDFKEDGKGIDVHNFDSRVIPKTALSE